MNRRTRYLLVPLCASLALGISGCGDDDAPDSAATVPEATEDAAPNTTAGAGDATTSTTAVAPSLLGRSLPEGVGLGYLGLSPDEALAKAEADGLDLIQTSGGMGMGAPPTEVRVVLGGEPIQVIVASQTQPDGSETVEGGDLDLLGYVGLTEEEAGALAEEQGQEWQALAAGTQPGLYEAERVTFIIEDGVVLRAFRG
jgi:hypothetical protein